MTFIAILIGYGLGSIPFGLLLTRTQGINIRCMGSGNIGTANVLRSGRKDLAAATLFFDAGKGIVAVLIARRLAGPPAEALAGLGAVLGHILPPWLGFRGGKGVATGLGVLLAADFPLGLATCAVWLLVAFLFRIASLAAFVAFPAAVIFAALTAKGRFTLVVLAIMLAVLIAHRANFRRLLAGTEPHFGKRP